MQGRILRIGQIAGRIVKKPLTWASVIGVTGMSCAGIALATVPAQATPIPPSASQCQYSNSATAANANAVSGVTPGSVVTVSCPAGSFAAGSILAMIEASGLAGVVSPTSAQLNEVDLGGSLKLAFAGADGSLNTTYTVPTSYKAPDPAAQCPAPQDQINAGLSCMLVIANLAAQPLDEAMLNYVGQGVPNTPTFHITFSVNHGVKTLVASDVPGACPTPVTAASHCWWGTGVTGAPSNTITAIPGLQAKIGKVVAANNLSVSPAVYCQTGSIDVQCAGLPAGTLVPPALSGTITTSLGLPPVTIDEPNATPYPGNGSMASLIGGTSNVEALQTGEAVNTAG